MVDVGVAHTITIPIARLVKDEDGGRSERRE
jgi:hypothetical protein